MIDSLAFARAICFAVEAAMNQGAEQVHAMLQQYAKEGYLTQMYSFQHDESHRSTLYELHFSDSLLQMVGQPWQIEFEENEHGLFMRFWSGELQLKSIDDYRGRKVKIPGLD